MRQDGTRAYFFKLEELESLITEAGGKVISLEYTGSMFASDEMFLKNFL